jgi:hypothetical protein
MSEKAINWSAVATDDDLADAAHFLTLLGVGTLNDRDLHPAKDLLRAARLPPLPRDNEGAAKWFKRVKAGEEVPPVLLVRGDLFTDRPLLIAEGYHRVSACYLLSEQTSVAVHFLR